MSGNSETLYRLILDSITEGVFTVDAEFRLTSLNAEAERITGIRREDAVGPDLCLHRRDAGRRGRTGRRGGGLP